MKKILNFSCLVILGLILCTGSLYSYTNVSPADVHTRLVQGDTLLLLDVRELYEYKNGHIAEPEGQLPVTPVTMPWSSAILSENYQQLPANMDIIVYCASGNRSKSASAFLDEKGFTRIFNMSGGFGSWTFEKRTNGFGDHSGAWLHTTDSDPVTFNCAGNNIPASLSLPPAVLGELDSAYFELHLASGTSLIPPNVPQSDVVGLYRVTALNQFGLSLFNGDSLSLAEQCTLLLYFTPNEFSSLPRDDRMTVYVPGKGWAPVPHTLEGIGYQRLETVLHKWYNLEGFYGTGINKTGKKKALTIDVFPNPFNSSLIIQTPEQAAISIYDITGRLITDLHSRTWVPSPQTGSGIYFIHIRYGNEQAIRQVLYLK